MELPNSSCHGVLHPRYTSPLETPLASPLRGVQRGNTTGLQGMEGTSLGGGLVLVSACLTVSPPITGEQAHTHTQGESESIIKYRSHFDGLTLELAQCKVVIPSILLVMLFLCALHS